MQKSEIDALMQKYEHFAESLAAARFSANSLFYCAIGIEKDDLLQEARVGLYKALLSYNPSAGAAFKTYAQRCIKNEMQAAVRSACSAKNMVLSNAASLEGVEKEIPGPEGEVVFGSLLSGLLSGQGPKLSPLENEVAKRLCEGKSYKEIAAELGKTPKSIDNAIQRLRIKIRDYIS